MEHLREDLERAEAGPKKPERVCTPGDRCSRRHIGKAILEQGPPGREKEEGRWCHRLQRGKERTAASLGCGHARVTAIGDPQLVSLPEGASKAVAG